MNEVDWPGTIAATPGDVETEKSIPVPVRATVCVLPFTPLLLSIIVSVPVRLPPTVGVKFTLIVQFAAAATEPPQVLV